VAVLTNTTSWRKRRLILRLAWPPGQHSSAMLNCLWAVTEQGSVPYSEVYLDRRVVLFFVPGRSRLDGLFRCPGEGDFVQSRPPSAWLPGGPRRHRGVFYRWASAKSSVWMSTVCV